MIDAFCIFERGGAVLWRRAYVPLRGDPLAAFVRGVLLQDRLALREFHYRSYALRWSVDAARALVFVVLFQAALRPAYAPDLLRRARARFAPRMRARAPAAVDTAADYSSFAKTFDALTDAAERRALRRAARPASPPPSRALQPPPPPPSPPSPPLTDKPPPPHMHKPPPPRPKPPAHAARAARRQQRGARAAQQQQQQQPPQRAQPPKPRAKKMRPPAKSRADAVSALDLSERPAADADADASTTVADGDDDDDERLQQFRERFLPRGAEQDADAHSSLSASDSSSDDEDDDERGGGGGGGVLSYLGALAGGTTLSDEQLQPAMRHFGEFLVGKNVAHDVAEQLMQSVQQSLRGQRVRSARGVRGAVRQAVHDALTRTLSARGGGGGGGLVADIEARRGGAGGERRRRPYVVTFCGVNGVGKSTTLAKTAYYLRRHGLTVMIAACDTFRAGAVEQLRTHVRCLGDGVQLFDKGYGRDAAAVAGDAIRRAAELALDVVLVDTAGRMQHNAPLMAALARLVRANRPERVLFVGEALAGNDAVDQVRQFARALAELAAGARLHGVVLTKMDTVDDRVGAAVSLVYATGVPIEFVGVGQTYTDLRRVDTRALVNALLR